MHLNDFKSINIGGIDMKEIYLNGKLLWSIPTSRLPNAYQEVEWIQAAANVGAYINLGFSYDTGAVVHLGQWIMNDNTAYPFGAAENSGKLRCMFSIPYSSDAVAYGSIGTASLAVGGISYTKNALNEFVATFEAGRMVWRNLTRGTTYTDRALISYTMSSNLYLFAQNYNGSPRFGDIRRISYFQYYDENDTLICDLVPCYRKSDGVAGMYDLVRKIFLTNVGAGSFTRGPAVKPKFYTNLVPLSTEIDGVTIYNGGLGYKDKTRIRSGGAETEHGSASHTGYMKAKGGDVVRLSGYDAMVVDTANAINVYDGTHTNLGQITPNYYDAGYGIFASTYKNYGWGNANGVKEEKTGVYVWTVPPDASIEYMRVTGYTNADGSKMIVTINEEIE